MLNKQHKWLLPFGGDFGTTGCRLLRRGKEICAWLCFQSPNENNKEGTNYRNKSLTMAKKSWVSTSSLKCTINTTQTCRSWKLLLEGSTRFGSFRCDCSLWMLSFLVVGIIWQHSLAKFSFRSLTFLFLWIDWFDDGEYYRWNLHRHWSTSHTAFPNESEDSSQFWHRGFQFYHHHQQCNAPEEE